MAKAKAKDAPAKAPKGRAKAPAAEPDGPALSRYQKFEPRRVHRRELKNAPYNPRTLDDYKRKKLTEILKKRGLLSAVTWNEKTGNLVSGHQRLMILDALEGSDDYLLDVDVVKLTPKAEREANIAFNNQSIQGDWDFDKLAALLKTPDLNVDDTGFDPMELQLMFDGTKYQNMFSPEVHAPQVVRDLGTLGAMGRPSSAPPASGGPEPEEGFSHGEEEEEEEGQEGLHADAPPLTTEAGEVVRDPEAWQGVKDERERMRERMKAAQEAKDPNFYIYVVFGSSDEREAFMAGIDEPEASTMADGRRLAHRLGIELPVAGRPAA